MAAELAPSELIEGAFGIHVPYPIAPVDLNHRRSKHGRDNDHRLYPGEHPRIKTPNWILDGRANITDERVFDERRIARWAGLQNVSKWLHHRKHEIYPDGTILPEGEHQNFALAILFSAGYVGDLALDVSRRNPRLVRVDDEMRAELQRPGVLHQQEDRHWTIGYFFGRYILENGLQEVMDTELMGQFMDEAINPKLRMRLGFRVISAAAEVVLDPVEPVYQQAHSQGHISPETPKTARRFVMSHFDNRQPDYFDTVAELARAS